MSTSGVSRSNRDISYRNMMLVRAGFGTAFAVRDQLYK